MGSPETKKEGTSDTLSAPSIGDKLGLLNLASRAGQELNAGRIEELLEGLKRIVLPMVRWLDKPLSEQGSLKWVKIPPDWQRKRALLVYDKNRLKLALTRTGEWLAYFHKDKEVGLGRLESLELANLLFDRLDDLIPELVFLAIEKTWREGLVNMPFLSGLLRRVAFIQFMLECRRTIDTLIVQQEERSRLMRARVDLLADFSHAQDPLADGTKKAELPDYAIYEDHERGTSNQASPYLTSEALEPFWKFFRGYWSPNETKGYRLVSGPLQLKSLKCLVERVGYILEEIEFAKSRDLTDARKLFGYSSGRLPLSEAEIAVLRALVESLEV